MNKFVYVDDRVDPDNPNQVVVCSPGENFRLAIEVRMPDGTMIRASDMDEESMPIDRLAGSWPVPGAVPVWAETEDETVARCMKMNEELVPPGNQMVVIPTDALPPTREFRDAWAIDGNRVVVNMVQARVIHLKKIRMARDKKLTQLDGEWMRAMGRGMKGDAAEIENRRQDLRELPQTLNLDAVATPEELSKIWPEGLDERFRWKPPGDGGRPSKNPPPSQYRPDLARRPTVPYVAPSQPTYTGPPPPDAPPPREGG